MRIENDIKTTIAVMAVMLAGFVGIDHWTHESDRAQLQARIDAGTAQLAEGRRSTQSVESLREHVLALRQQASQTQKIVPATSELADVLRQISGLLTGREMQNQEVQTNAIVAGPQFNMIPLSLRFDGSYAGAFEVVRGIEASSRLMRINRLELIGVPTRPDEPVVIRMDVMTFSSAAEANRHE